MIIMNNGQLKNSCSRRVYKPVPAFCDSDLSASLLSAQLSQFESYQYYIVMITLNWESLEAEARLAPSSVCFCINASSL